MLSQAFVSTTYWSYVALTVVSLINLLPTSVLNFVSPWFQLYSSHPDLSKLKVFCCACNPHLRSYSNHKFEPRTKECLFLGYSSTSKGYLCLDVQSQHLYTSRHVLFNKTKFPFPTLSKSLTFSSSLTSVLSNSLWLSNLLFLHSSNQPSLLGPYTSPTTSSVPSNSFITQFAPPLTNTAPLPSISILVNPSQPHPTPPSMATEPLPEASSFTPIPSSVPTCPIPVPAVPNLHTMQMVCCRRQPKIKPILLKIYVVVRVRIVPMESI